MDLEKRIEQLEKRVQIIEEKQEQLENRQNYNDIVVREIFRLLDRIETKIDKMLKVNISE